MNENTLRKQILEFESEVEAELGVEVSVYGVGSGYKVLSGFLRGDRPLDESVRKQAHQYWTFLALVQSLADSVELTQEDKLLFSPSRGKGSQFSAAPSLFVEPALPVYPEQELWTQFNSELSYLREPGESGEPKHHPQPDFLLTDDGVDSLPWTARSHQPIENESQLMEWCATGELERVAAELGLAEVPSSASECYQAVQQSGDHKDTADLYTDWREFNDNARYLIECKHEPLTESDYSQILWYGIAYETPLVVVSAAPITNQRFQRDLESLPIQVRTVEQFEVGTSSAKVEFIT